VGEPHALGVEHVEDRVPPVGKILVAGVDHVGRYRREECDIRPDLRPGEADDGVHAHLARDLRSELQLLGRALAHPLGLTVAPDPRAHDRLVPEVDRVVADRLALEVVRDGPDLQPVPVEQVEPALEVGGVLRRAPHVEMLARARDLQAVVAPAARVGSDLLERQVRPLAGEERHRMRRARARVLHDSPVRVAHAVTPCSVR
jgi:hypothetical protein